jgi:hypothetical protein
MRERRSAGDLNMRIPISCSRDPLVSLRGAAVAVLRASVYRRFFDSPKLQPGPTSEDPGKRWAGWDNEHSGGQTGEFDGKGKWLYTPQKIDRLFVDDLRKRRISEGVREASAAR